MERPPAARDMVATLRKSAKSAVINRFRIEENFSKPKEPRSDSRPRLCPGSDRAKSRRKRRAGRSRRRASFRPDRKLRGPFRCAISSGQEESSETRASLGMTSRKLNKINANVNSSPIGRERKGRLGKSRSDGFLTKCGMSRIVHAEALGGIFSW